MRNLIVFIWKNYFFFLFLVLETIAFYLIIRNNRFQNTSVFNSSNTISGNIYQSYSNITDYLYLKKDNELLAAQNAKLQTFSVNSFITFKNDEYSVNDPVYKQKYIYTQAKVINNSINKRNNYLTLNAGRLQHIEPEMAVIAADGVVGIVKDVSDNFSSVMSLLNKNTMISCKLKKGGYFGSLIWEGGNPAIAILNDIPKHARISVGDTIITSGASPIFPEGIMAGTINRFELEEGNNFYSVEVKLSTDFGRLSYVYVIKNLMKQEQIDLEKATQNDN